MKSTAKQRVLAALRTGPKLTSDLCQPDVGGVRFGGRIKELREDGHTIEDHCIRQGSWRYTLVSEATAAPADRSHLTLVESKPHRWPGPYVVCTRCSWTFDEAGSSTHCTSCGAGAHWLEEHTHRQDRDRRAKLIDPAAVARELQYIARAKANRARKAAA